jgi:tRNA pseudouridine55 synthase
VAALGAESPTGDVEGLDGALPPAVPTPPAAVVLAAEERLRGTYLQQPPAFSAKKIGGVRAHRLARRGYEAPLAPVPVTVHRLRLVRAAGGRIHFAAEVSSGTYLRSLARDLGRLLGTGAYLAALRRTGIGPLRVRQALRPAWETGCPGIADRVLGLEAIPLRLPTVVLDRDGGRLFSQGRPVPGPPGAVVGTVRALDAAGLLLGVAEVAVGGDLAPRTVLREADPSTEGGAGSWSLAHPVDGW